MDAGGSRGCVRGGRVVVCQVPLPPGGGATRLRNRHSATQPRMRTHRGPPGVRAGAAGCTRMHARRGADGGKRTAGRRGGGRGGNGDGRQVVTVALRPQHRLLPARSSRHGRRPNCASARSFTRPMARPPMCSAAESPVATGACRCCRARARAGHGTQHGPCLVRRVSRSR